MRNHRNRVVFSAPNYSMPRTSFASSDILLLSHGGSQTRLTWTEATPAPGMASTCERAWLGSESATGQLGVVSVMSITTRLDGAGVDEPGLVASGLTDGWSRMSIL